MADFLINDYYPPEYFALPGAADNPRPNALWWSSRERLAIENGSPTSEYMEIDFGRPRSLNFLSFDILRKPISVSIEYDARSFLDGTHLWVPVTPLRDESFSSYIDYQPQATNAWLHCQYYFVNTLGEMITTRWLRLHFQRRDKPWPTTSLPAFPWSIDIANLRTSRYITNLDDARGLLVDAGTVTGPLTP